MDHGQDTVDYLSLLPEMTPESVCPLFEWIGHHSTKVFGKVLNIE